MGNQQLTTSDEGFAPVLRAAIAERGLSLGRLRYHLGTRGHEVSVATLSYWQSGRSRPERARSLAALSCLEEILDLSPGALSQRLAKRSRRLPPSAPIAVRGHAELTADGHIMDQLAADLGSTWDEGIERIGVYESIDIRPDRTEDTHNVRELIRATRRGIDRVMRVFQHDDPRATARIEASKNCRIGRVLGAADQGVTVWELLLNRPLDLGDPLLVEYNLAVDGQQLPSSSWERGCLRPLRELHLEVRFAESAMPVAAEEFWVRDGIERSAPVLLAGNVITLLREDFGPGTSGMRWRW